MKIVKLNSENVLRLHAVEITPEGSLVVIGGENEQGKTSVLDSIVLAMGGRLAQHPEPLHKGEDKGKIVVELEDLTVTRTFTPAGGGVLTVANKEGAKYSSPQKMLDKMLGSLSFDPLAWERYEPAKQSKMLRELVGLDLTSLDTKRADVYERRTVIGREVKSLEARLKAKPPYDPEATAAKSLEALATELQLAQEADAAIKDRQQEIQLLQLDIDKTKDRIRDITETITRLMEDRAKLMGNANMAQNQIVALKAALETAPPSGVLGIIASMQEIEVHNAKVRANQERKVLEGGLEETRKEHESLSAILEKIDQDKSDALANAKWPIPGLSILNDLVMYNGVPFSQASSAEKLKVSLAMGIALNPALRVMLIRDGSLLDQKNLKLVAEMAAQNDMQVWIERVGEGPECQVIIEDGRVKEVA